MPVPRRDFGRRQAGNRVTARRWAWALGFCLPLSGGVGLSMWIPGYPDQVTIIRLVTLGALIWLFLRPMGTAMPTASKRMLEAFAVFWTYAAVSVTWAPDLLHGLHNLVTIGLALSTAVAVLLMIRDDRLAVRSFVIGVLISGGLQVFVAAAEVLTGRHLSLGFGADYVAQWSLTSIEQAVGAVAWGSLGNPNDLGGYFLLTTALFLSMGAYGLVLRRPVLWFGWGLLLLSAFVGMTALADARAYRLGLLAVIAMYLLDRVLTPGRTRLRVPAVVILAGAGLALASTIVGPALQTISGAGASDALRLVLIREGLVTSFISGGFGRGLGTEQSLIDSRIIPLNFHNVIVQLAAELGLVVAGAFLVYLVSLVISWALVTRSARRMGHEASLARATVAVALIIYGITSSGVLESPHFWVFFAVTAVVSGLAEESEGAVRHQSRATTAVGLRRIGQTTERV